MPLSVPRNRWVLSRIAVSVALATVLSGAVLAVGRDKALYVRGTLSAIKEKSEGRFDTQPETELAFSAGNRGSVAIPYAAIASLEFEQKERLVVVIGLGPPVSKRLAHYLTITYSDPAGKQQSGVFELGKDVVRTLLKILEVRSGKAIAFQDADTCRQYKTPKECEGNAPSGAAQTWLGTNRLLPRAPRLPARLPGPGRRRVLRRREPG